MFHIGLVDMGVMGHIDISIGEIMESLFLCSAVRVLARVETKFWSEQDIKMPKKLSFSNHE